MSGQSFPIQDVLGVTSGILLGEFVDMVKVMEYVLGDGIWTHQIPAAAKAAKPAILEQHPWLAEAGEILNPHVGDWPALESALASIVAEFGMTTVVLEPAADAAWRRGNALTDAVDLFGDRLIVVEGGES